MAVPRANRLRPTRDARPIPLNDTVTAEPRRSYGLTQVASRPTMALWFLMAADLATVVWMYTFGAWLDRTSKFTATATLGGHHVIVLVIAALAFATLVTLALLTDGYTRWTPRLALARNAACILSVVALTGLLALVLASLLSRILFGRLRP